MIWLTTRFAEYITNMDSLSGALSNGVVRALSISLAAHFAGVKVSMPSAELLTQRRSLHQRSGNGVGGLLMRVAVRFCVWHAISA